MRSLLTGTSCESVALVTALSLPAVIGPVGVKVATMRIRTTGLFPIPRQRSARVRPSRLSEPERSKSSSHSPIVAPVYLAGRLLAGRSRGRGVQLQSSSTMARSNGLCSWRPDPAIILRVTKPRPHADPPALALPMDQAAEALA